jgi:hypothetical protein
LRIVQRSPRLHAKQPKLPLEAMLLREVFEAFRAFSWKRF